MPPKENEIEQSELFALEEQVADLKNALYDARKQLKSAICIPENATNGDMIKTMFPTCRPIEGTLLIDTDIAVFEPDWWKAPYKRTEG